MPNNVTTENITKKDLIDNIKKIIWTFLHCNNIYFFKF